MSYLVDNGSVFYLMRGLRYELKLNLSELHIFDKHFARDDQKVFHEGVQVRNADPKTFIPLSSCHGKDAKSIYWKTLPIGGADVQSFNVIDDYFGRDRRSIFAGSHLMEKAEPTSFRPIDSRYSLDSRHVYDGRDIVQGVSPSQFNSWGYYIRIGPILSFQGEPVWEPIQINFQPGLILIMR